MKATIVQENGVSLSIEPIPGSENQIVAVRLVGTKLSSEITEALEPAFEGMGSLSSFLKKAALRQTALPAERRSLCEDLAFTVSNEPHFEGFLLLRVYIGSNSDDESNWQVNASLLVTPEKLLSFASSVSGM
ncbi:MAG: hypothetical protein V4719_18675 [Planctomycetota bacterium]